MPRKKPSPFALIHWDYRAPRWLLIREPHMGVLTLKADYFHEAEADAASLGYTWICDGSAVLVELSVLASIRRTAMRDSGLRPFERNCRCLRTGRRITEGHTVKAFRVGGTPEARRHAELQLDAKRREREALANLCARAEPWRTDAILRAEAWCRLP